MVSWMRSLGLTELEESAYRALLRRPDISLHGLAEDVQVSRDRVKGVAARLEELGLVIRTPQRHSRLQPVPPGVAVEALVTMRIAELERARRSIPELTEEFQSAQTAPRRTERFVELVQGDEAIRNHYLKLLMSARSEIVGFVTPPFMVDDGCEEVEEEATARGVKGRFLYDHAAMSTQGMAEGMERELEQGIEIRVLDALPMKLMLFDGEVAFIPATSEAPGTEPELLIIRPSRLLESLMTLFELLWERGSPFPSKHEASAMSPSLDSVDRDILRLMRVGLKDESIARNLGIGLRTLRRRIQRLMRELGAETRFQAGAHATARGWIP